MATTTNYSWTTPDDTALVKDGAAAIRSLGTAIDTTVFNNAAAAIAKATVDAKGDLIVGTADNTIDRLAVGANDTVLIADSSTATGLKWGAPAAGGMTLLSTTTLSSATTTISVGSGYIDLVLHFTGIYLPSASQGFEIRYNTVSSGYNSVFLYQASGGATVENNNNQNGVGTAGSALTDADNQYLFGYMRFFDYLGTAGMKSFQGQIAARNDSEVYFGRTFFGANSATPAAITQVQFVTGAASFSGGTVKVYGVK